MEKKIFRPREDNRSVAPKHKLLAYQLFLASDTKSRNPENTEKIDWSKLVDDAICDVYAFQFSSDEDEKILLEERINDGIEYVVLLEKFVEYNRVDYDNKTLEEIKQVVSKIKKYLFKHRENKIDILERTEIEKDSRRIQKAIANTNNDQWGEVLDDFHLFYEDLSK